MPQLPLLQSLEASPTIVATVTLGSVTYYIVTLGSVTYYRTDIVSGETLSVVKHIARFL